MTLEEVLKEVNLLKDENKRLKDILRQHNIKYEIQLISNLSEQEKIDIYMSYFKARKDALTEKYITRDGKKGYAKGCANRFSPICDYIKYRGCKSCPNYKGKEYNQSIVKQHLDGIKAYGVYPMLEYNTCYFLAVDFDDLDFKSAALSYYNECALNGLDALIELSQSCKGAHVWIFFEEPHSAKLVRMIGDYLLTCAISNNDKISFKSYDRFFPSQDTVDKGGFGNCIGLPLFGKCVKNGTSVFVDDNFIPYQDQISKLKSVKKVSSIEFDLLVNKINANKNLIELDCKKIDKLNLRMSDFPKTVKVLLKNDIFISKTGISSKGLSAIKRLGVISNPEYYEKQRMRMSTYNIPRVIQLFKEDDRTISLPRGCLVELETIFNHFNFDMS